ncbi:hypothetical protein CFBP4996_19710 [Agrobacterium leguminum]|uniref:Uncharacterized protein n=1 Tax=Agrobacterium deltaense NCPPB 1641 TaxID=1183425 RepID=A0A1S7TVX5_9HYPH|nr:MULTISPECIES: hypothetical protein [Agrobacterium]WFS68243.1 hypothetical protein CFBP4996_19710 [Agrobacterium leguminum]CVI58778.1 hypothetical protein AGR7A_Lc120255 [Agrobacterium deltaense NCPPB 1641]
MSKVKYVAGDSGADEVKAFGYSFKDGKSVEVKDADIGRFSGNPFFEVSSKAEKSEDADELKAVHNGGGRYVIKKGGEVVKDGLSKTDAEAFNRMSDEDKAEYVAA